MTGNVAADGADAALEAVRQCFIQINEWLPVLGDFLEMITQWPEARHDRLFDLSDSYQAAAELYANHLEEIQDYIRDLSVWQGDGAAQVVRESLQGYMDETASMGEALGSMQQLVHGKALEIESMKWMAVITLVMMAIALIQAIITIWTGIGAAAGAAAIATGRATIYTVARELLRKLWQETIKAGIRRFVQSGIRGVGAAALRGGLAYAGFMGAMKGGILLIQALEGHDPFTEGWAGRFGMELVDSFIAGAIGGPLMFGIHSRVTEAVAFGLGQVADNFLQIGRDRLIDQMGLTEWAQRNGVYSGMTLGNVWESVTPAALLGEILSEPGGRHRPNVVTPALNQGVGNLFGGGSSGQNAPSGLGQGGGQSGGLGNRGNLGGQTGLPGALPGQSGQTGAGGSTGSQGGSSGSSSGSRSTGGTSTGGSSSSSSSSSSAPSSSSSGSSSSSSSSSSGGQRGESSSSTGTQTGGTPATGDGGTTAPPATGDGTTQTGTPAVATPDAGTPATPDGGTPVAGTPATPDGGTPATPDAGTPATPDGGRPD
ncbi:WXG100-like domain-containing protein, partial [Phytohabitans suffuscus]